LSEDEQATSDSGQEFHRIILSAPKGGAAWPRFYAGDRSPAPVQ
jgi:hypothetical protein